MTVFLDYLQEAYVNETHLTSVEYEMYVKPYLATLINEQDYTHEDLLLADKLIPSKVQDYFAENFERCSVCKEWTRRTDLEQARYDVNDNVCPQCREDGN